MDTLNLATPKQRVRNICANRDHILSGHNLFLQGRSFYPVFDDGAVGRIPAVNDFVVRFAMIHEWQNCRNMVAPEIRKYALSVE